MLSGPVPDWAQLSASFSAALTITCLSSGVFMASNERACGPYFLGDRRYAWRLGRLAAWLSGTQRQRIPPKSRSSPGDSDWARHPDGDVARSSDPALRLGEGIVSSRLRYHRA